MVHLGQFEEGFAITNAAVFGFVGLHARSALDAGYTVETPFGVQALEASGTGRDFALVYVCISKRFAILTLLLAKMLRRSIIMPIL